VCVCVCEKGGGKERKRKIVKDEEDMKRDVDVLHAPLSLTGWVGKCRRKGEIEWRVC